MPESSYSIKLHTTNTKLGIKVVKALLLAMQPQ